MLINHFFEFAWSALKHYTSKIEDFDDLSYVRTFGFRGEALSSLCVLGKVTILTATREEAPMGTLLEFAQDGSIHDRSKKMARQVSPLCRASSHASCTDNATASSHKPQRGCTVSVSDLFHSLPVRRRELEKNCKREYGKAQSLLQAYSLISRGVRWQVVNISKEGSVKRLPGRPSRYHRMISELMLTYSAFTPQKEDRRSDTLVGVDRRLAIEELRRSLRIKVTGEHAAA